MKSIAKFISILVFLVKLFIIFLTLIDLVGVISNPENYRLSQGFSEKELSILSPSVRNYIISQVLLFFLFAGLLFFDFKYLKNRLSKRQEKIYWVINVVLTVLLIIGYCLWMRTGFDK
jgi:hypothetical protein